MLGGKKSAKNADLEMARQKWASMLKASHMKNCVLAVATIFLAFGGAASVRAGQLMTYGVPPAPIFYTQHNNDYTVRVRVPGGDWKDLFAYKLRVDWHHPQDASLVYFDFEGEVEVEVEKNNGTFRTASLLPTLPGVEVTRTGNVVRFILKKPQRFSVQFDDDRLHNLHVLAGAIPPPRPAGENVRVFDPGLHAPEDGSKTFVVKSGDTIYLEGGAILEGNFSIKNVRNVRILGRGLIYNPGQPIDLDQAQNVEIDDLIAVNDDLHSAARVVNIRHSSNVKVDGISGFTAGRWSDGINISTSQHVSIDHVYLRTSDDAVVVYAVSDCPICPARDDTAPSPLDYDTFDIKVSNSLLWPDVAHAMFIGHFGDATHPRTIHDVEFNNIEVLNLDESQPDWQGAIAIFSGDTTLIRDVSFTDIQVDRITDGKLINIVTGNNERYNKAPGRGVENVVLRNISYSGEGLPGPSIISGLSPDAKIQGVTIDNLQIGGKRIRSAAGGDIKVGPYVDGLTIK